MKVENQKQKTRTKKRAIVEKFPKSEKVLPWENDYLSDDSGDEFSLSFEMIPIPLVQSKDLHIYQYRLPLEQTIDQVIVNGHYTGTVNQYGCPEGYGQWEFGSPSGLLYLVGEWLEGELKVGKAQVIVGEHWIYAGGWYRGQRQGIGVITPISLEKHDVTNKKAVVEWECDEIIKIYSDTLVDDAHGDSSIISNNPWVESFILSAKSIVCSLSWIPESQSLNGQTQKAKHVYLERTGKTSLAYRYWNDQGEKILGNIDEKSLNVYPENGRLVDFALKALFLKNSHYRANVNCWTTSNTSAQPMKLGEHLIYLGEQEQGKYHGFGVAIYECNDPAREVPIWKFCGEWQHDHLVSLYKEKELHEQLASTMMTLQRLLVQLLSANEKPPEVVYSMIDKLRTLDRYLPDQAVAWFGELGKLFPPTEEIAAFVNYVHALGHVFQSLKPFSNDPAAIDSLWKKYQCLGGECYEACQRQLHELNEDAQPHINEAEKAIENQFSHELNQAHPLIMKNIKGENVLKRYPVLLYTHAMRLEQTINQAKVNGHYTGTVNQDGCPEGYGQWEFESPSGLLYLVGEWLKGELKVGKARVIVGEHQIYEGDWSRGQRQGIGVITPISLEKHDMTNKKAVIEWECDKIIKIHSDTLTDEIHVKLGEHLIYLGEREQGKCHGFGVAIYECNDPARQMPAWKFCGEWQHDHLVSLYKEKELHEQLVDIMKTLQDLLQASLSTNEERPEVIYPMINKLGILSPYSPDQTVAWFGELGKLFPPTEEIAAFVNYVHALGLVFQSLKPFSNDPAAIDALWEMYQCLGGECYEACQRQLHKLNKDAQGHINEAEKAIENQFSHELNQAHPLFKQFNAFQREFKATMQNLKGENVLKQYQVLLYTQERVSQLYQFQKNRIQRVENGQLSFGQETEIVTAVFNAQINYIIQKMNDSYDYQGSLPFVDYVKQLGFLYHLFLSTFYHLCVTSWNQSRLAGISGEVIEDWYFEVNNELQLVGLDQENDVGQKRFQALSLIQKIYVTLYVFLQTTFKAENEIVAIEKTWRVLLEHINNITQQYLPVEKVFARNLHKGMQKFYSKQKMTIERDKKNNKINGEIYRKNLDIILTYHLQLLEQCSDIFWQPVLYMDRNIEMSQAALRERTLGSFVLVPQENAGRFVRSDSIFDWQLYQLMSDEKSKDEKTFQSCQWRDFQELRSALDQYSTLSLLDLNPSDSRLVMLNAKHDDDSLFHALFGEWNASQQKIICTHVNKLHQQLAKCIRQVGSPKNPLYRWIQAAIKAQLISQSQLYLEESENIIILDDNLHHLKKVEKNQKWQFLKAHLQALQFLNVNSTNQTDEKMRTEFHRLLSVKDGLLLHLIFSMPEIADAFEAYHITLYPKHTNWNQDILPESKLWMDYVEHIEKNMTKLLPLELSLLAYQYGMQVELYVGEMEKPIVYGPQKNISTYLYYDGDYYNRLVTRETHPQLELLKSPLLKNDIITDLTKQLGRSKKANLYHFGEYAFHVAIDRQLTCQLEHTNPQGELKHTSKDLFRQNKEFFQAYQAMLTLFDQLTEQFPVIDLIQSIQACLHMILSQWPKHYMPTPTEYLFTRKNREHHQLLPERLYFARIPAKQFFYYFVIQYGLEEQSSLVEQGKVTKHAYRWLDEHTAREDLEKSDAILLSSLTEKEKMLLLNNTSYPSYAHSKQCTDFFENMIAYFSTVVACLRNTQIDEVRAILTLLSELLTTFIFRHVKKTKHADHTHLNPFYQEPLIHRAELNGLILKSIGDNLNLFKRELNKKNVNGKESGDAHELVKQRFQLAFSRHHTCESLGQHLVQLGEMLKFKSRLRAIKPLQAIVEFEKKISGGDVAPSMKRRRDMLQLYTSYKSTYKEGFKSYLHSKRNVSDEFFIQSLLRKMWIKPGVTLISIPEQLAYLALILVLRLEKNKDLIHSASPLLQNDLLKPLCIQIISVFYLLGLDLAPPDTMHVTNPPYRLLQIPTGQGKSWVLALTAAIFALQGDKVDVVCYNQDLSTRDREFFEKTFPELYGDFMTMASDAGGVWYITLDQLLARTQELTRIKKRLKAILEGRKISVYVAPHSPQRSVLLIDEVDVFFNQALWQSQPFALYKLSAPFFMTMKKIVWYAQLQKARRERAIDIHYEISQLINSEYPQFRFLTAPTKTLLDYCLEQCVSQSEAAAQDRAKMLPEGDSRPDPHIVWYKKALYRIWADERGENVRLITDNLFHWLYYHHWFRKFEPKSLDEVLAYELYSPLDDLSLPVSFEDLPISLPKNVEYPYSALLTHDRLQLGVSGTLEDMYDIQYEVLKQYGSVVQKIFGPSIFGGALTSHLRFNQKNNVKIIEGQEEWFASIYEQLILRAQEGRSVLVFFDDDDDNDTLNGVCLQKRATMAAFIEFCQKQPQPMSKNVNYFWERFYTGDPLRDDLRNQSKSTLPLNEIIKEVKNPYCVAILSRQRGRGTDFEVSSEVLNPEKGKQYGGMHVIQTFFSGDRSEERQIQGRTARRDEAGSYELILELRMLQTQLSPQITLRTDYDTLERYRHQRVKTIYADIENTVNDGKKQQEKLYGFFNTVKHCNGSEKTRAIVAQQIMEFGR